jgi:hypothetical protein
MEIRDAILRAADHIERHPQDFNFGSVSIPVCGTPGCALGWISAYCDFPRGEHGFSKCCDLLGLEPEFQTGIKLDAGAFKDQSFTFYNRMKKLGGSSWCSNAINCAEALRLYADKYHPAPVKEPDWNALAMAPLPVAERQYTAT